MISSNENQTHTQWLIDESSNNFGESFLDNINANEDLQKSTKIQTLEEYCGPNSVLSQGRGSLTDQPEGTNQSPA